MPAQPAAAMRDEDWRSLTASIENGTCILMLGPDAFMADFDGETLPVAVGLARWVLNEKLKDRLGAEEGEAEVLPLVSGPGVYRVIIGGAGDSTGDFQLTVERSPSGVN